MLSIVGSFFRLGFALLKNNSLALNYKRTSLSQLVTIKLYSRDPIRDDLCKCGFLRLIHLPGTTSFGRKDIWPIDILTDKCLVDTKFDRHTLS